MEDLYVMAVVFATAPIVVVFAVLYRRLGACPVANPTVE